MEGTGRVGEEEDMATEGREQRGNTRGGGKGIKTGTEEEQRGDGFEQREAASRCAVCPFARSPVLSGFGGGFIALVNGKLWRHNFFAGHVNHIVPVSSFLLFFLFFLFFLLFFFVLPSVLGREDCIHFPSSSKRKHKPSSLRSARAA